MNALWKKWWAGAHVTWMVMGGFVVLFGFLSTPQCLAQCGAGGYVPPPPDTSSTSDAPGGQNSTTTSTPANVGSSSTPSTPHTGMPTASKPTKTGAGGMTKKARGRTSNFVTWEFWWARNRYQFFDVADIVENAEKYDQNSTLFPVTPNPEPGMAERRQVNRLQMKSVKAILPFLDDRAPLLRRISLFALGRLRSEEGVEEMIEQLQDNNQYVRDAAILGLGINGSPEARHTVLHIALGTDTASRLLDQTPVPAYVRAIATVTLALTQSPGIEPTLQSIAMDEDSPADVRSMAFEGLGLMGGEDVAAFLIDCIDNPKLEPRIASHAISALSKTDELLGYMPMRKCLRSKEMPVRQAASMGLWRLAPPSDADTVQQLFFNFKNCNDQAVKGFSLISMGLVGGPEAAQKLYRIVSRGESSERPWACLALGFALRTVDDERAIKELIKKAETSGNRSTRGAACIALGLCKSEVAVPHLVKILKKADLPLLRGYAALALGMINDPAALEPLRTALKEDPLPQVLAGTVLALGIMHDLESAPHLMDLMIETPNVITKGMISRALQYMGRVNVAEEILHRLTTKTYDVCTTKECICLLSRLLSGQTAPYLDKLSANSNFVCEYPIVNHLLEYGL